MTPPYCVRGIAQHGMIYHDGIKRGGQGMSGVIPEEGGSQGPGDDPARLGLRTSLMTLNLLLSSVPTGTAGFADAAADARCLSRRIATATEDFCDLMRVAV